MLFNKKTDFKVKFWGVRGSIPVPGKKFAKYGGNTSCVELRCGDEIIVLDAGTGIRALGRSLLQEFNNQPLKINILISHTHWDHIQGFPFLPQIYIPGNTITFFGGHSVSTLEKLIMVQMSEEYHPKTLYELAAKVEFVQLSGSEFSIGNAKILFTHLIHPGLALGFRITYNNRVVAYLTDNEILSDKQLSRYNWENIGKLIQNADIVIHDAQYSPEEYAKKIGWGHSSYDQVVEICKDYNVKKLFLFHHDPIKTDKEIDVFVKKARLKAGCGLKVFGAKEFDEYYL